MQKFVQKFVPFLGAVLSVPLALSAAVIEPINDEKLAVVTVSHADASVYFMSRPPEVILSTGAGSTILQPNQRYRFLPAPTATLQLRQNFSLPKYTVRGTTALASGKLHNFVVPRLGFYWTEGAFKVDVGPIPYLEVFQMGSTRSFAKFPLNQEGLNTNAPALTLGVLPGTYEMSYSVVKPLTGKTQSSLKWGDEASLPLQERDVPERSTMRFHTVDKGTYSDAIVPHCQGSQVHVWTRPAGVATTEYKAVHNLPLKQNKPFQDVQFYASPHGSPIQYYAQFGNIQVPISVPPGKRGEIDVKRLDVNQVKVAREDQSEYWAPSTFEVFYKQADGTRAKYELMYFNCSIKVSTFTAPTGLYLPPGEYQVVMSYKTAEGAKIKEIDVKL